MDLKTATYSDLVCSICLNLLTENPDDDENPSKRPRLDNEPGPSSRINDTAPSVVATKCGHVYHEECIKESLKVKKVCPNCQGDRATRKSLLKIYLPLNPGQCVNCKQRKQEVNHCNEEKRELEEKLAGEMEKVRDSEKKVGEMGKIMEVCQTREREWRERAAKMCHEVNEKSEELKLEREKVDQLEIQLDEQKLESRRWQEKEDEVKEKVEEMRVREELILQENTRLEKDLENCNSRIASQMESLSKKSQQKNGQLSFLQRKLTLAEMEIERLKNDRDSERKKSEFLLSCLQQDAPQFAQCMDQHNGQLDVIAIPSQDEDATARTPEDNESIKNILESDLQVSDSEAENESDSETD